jgi:hypothetical protein
MADFEVKRSATNSVAFQLAEAAGSTEVTWVMTGEHVEFGRKYLVPSSEEAGYTAEVVATTKAALPTVARRTIRLTTR